MSRQISIGMMLKSTFCHLFLVKLLISQSLTVDLPDEINKWSSLTGDTYIFVGSDLKLNCNLSNECQQNCTSQNILFGFSNPQVQTEEKIIQSNNYAILNNEQAMLVVHNVTLENAGMFSCYVGNSCCQHKKITLIGVLEDVVVEYPPQNVTNFKCVVYNWDEQMKCTWLHSVNYVQWSQIIVTLSYTAKQTRPYLAHHCPRQSNNSCEFNNNSFSLGEVYIMKINVANNHSKTTTSKNFTVETLKIVKPSPVENLNIKANKPGCFVLSWTHPRQHRQKVYRIKHQNTASPLFELLIDNLANTTYTICGYQPYTHHYFSVECYPSFYTGYWSDPVVIHGLTSMTAPAIGPSTINGSFTATMCTNGFRKVTLMWKEIEMSARHGIIDGYFIKEGSTVIKKVSADVYKTSVEVSCDENTVLAILAHNQAGFSLEPSILLIPPSNIKVPGNIKDSFSIEILDQEDMVNAVWNPNSDGEIMNYTIFWCSLLSRQTCQNQINWIKVPGTYTEYNISLSSTDVESRKFLFGISVTYSQQHEMVSEIFWTSCLFRRHPTTVKSADWFKVDPEIESLRISWSPVQCTYEDQVKVTKYIIKICVKSYCSDSQSIQEVEVPATESSYTLSQLTANTKYKLTVQAVSDDTVGPEYEPWKEASPHPAESDLRLWWWAVPVVIVFLGFIAFTIKCYLRRGIIKQFNKQELHFFTNAKSEIPCNITPNLLPERPEDIMLNEISVGGVNQCQPSHEAVIDIPDQQSADQEDNECSSGDGSFNDQHNNSRVPLIKSSHKNCGASLLTAPSTHSSVPFGSSLKQQSNLLENKDVKAANNAQLNPKTNSGDSSQEESRHTNTIFDITTENGIAELSNLNHNSLGDADTFAQSLISYVQVADIDNSIQQKHAPTHNGNIQIINQVGCDPNALAKCSEPENSTNESHTENVAIADQQEHQQAKKTSNFVYITIAAAFDHDLQDNATVSGTTSSTLSSDFHYDISPDPIDSGQSVHSKSHTENSK